MRNFKYDFQGKTHEEGIRLKKVPKTSIKAPLVGFPILLILLVVAFIEAFSYLQLPSQYFAGILLMPAIAGFAFAKKAKSLEHYCFVMKKHSLFVLILVSIPYALYVYSNSLFAIASLFFLFAAGLIINHKKGLSAEAFSGRASFFAFFFPLMISGLSLLIGYYFFPFGLSEMTLLGIAEMGHISFISLFILQFLFMVFALNWVLGLGEFGLRSYLIKELHSHGGIFSAIVISIIFSIILYIPIFLLVPGTQELYSILLFVINIALWAPIFAWLLIKTSNIYPLALMSSTLLTAAIMLTGNFIFSPVGLVAGAVPWQYSILGLTGLVVAPFSLLFLWRIKRLNKMYIIKI